MKNNGDKDYLILLDFYNNYGESRQVYEFIHGRDQVIKDLIDYCMIHGVDGFRISLSESKILVEGVSIKEPQELLKFLNYCVSYNYISQDDLESLTSYGYINEQNEEDVQNPSVIHGINNEKVNNFIDDSILKEEV